MTRRAVWTIGVGQCVGWGVLYYAFGVLLVPVEHHLGVARWLVAGVSSPLIATGVTLFACGSGLATLARPYLVLALCGAERAGQINGVIARWQQLARAGGPVAAAALAASTGYGVVFGLLSGLLTVVGVIVLRGQDVASHG